MINALASSVRNGFDTALCHNPRHGLYIQNDDFTIDVSICFECHNIYLFGPSSDVDNLGPFAGYQGAISITDDPMSLFNAALKKHGVPIGDPD